MSTQSSRPGGYRVCPSCGARHKPHVMMCATCGASLAAASIWHAGPMASRTMTHTMQARVIRGLVAGGVLAAIGAGLWVRSVFRGAALEQTARAEVRADAPPAQPEWTPPALPYPQVGGSSLAYTGPLPLPVNPSTIVMPAPVLADVPVSGMVSITPSVTPATQGTAGRTSFTDADLARLRAGGAAAPPAAVPSASIPAATAPAASDETLRAWRERIRDRQDAVQAARAKVRRLAAEAAAARVQLTVAGADAEAHEKARRELEDRLDDLEKAEKAASSAERDLEEEKERAAREGITIR